MEMLIFALALCTTLFAGGFLGLLFTLKPLRPEPNGVLTPQEAQIKWESAGKAKTGPFIPVFFPLVSALKEEEKKLALAARSRPLALWERRLIQNAPLLKQGIVRLRRRRGMLAGQPLSDGMPRILLLCRLAIRSSARAAGAGDLERSSFLRALAEGEGTEVFAYARTLALIQLTLTPPGEGGPEEERWLGRLNELILLFGEKEGDRPWQEGGFYVFRDPEAAACLSSGKGGVLVHRTGFYLTLSGRRVHLNLALTPRAATRTRLSFSWGKIHMAAELFCEGLWLEYPPSESETVSRLFLRPLLHALRLPHAEWVRRREGSFLVFAKSAAGLKEGKALCKKNRLLNPIRSEFGYFGRRLSHLLDNMNRPRSWKQEQLFLLLGRLRGMRGEEFYRDARFCLLTADGHLTAAELEKISDLTLVLNRFGLTFFLLIAGRRQDLPPLTEAQRKKLGKAGFRLIPPDHPGLSILAEQADLVCRGGKYRFGVFEEDPEPMPDPVCRPVLTSLDELFGLEEIAARLTPSVTQPGEPDLAFFFSGPKDQKGAKRELLDLFAHQTLDGSVCRAFTEHTAVAGDRRSTLVAVLAALLYAGFFTEAEVWEERIPYLECPQDFGLTAPSAISDSLRYHVCNALQFLLTADQNEGEAAFMNLLTEWAVRRVLPGLPEGCVKKQLRLELEKLPPAPDTPLSLALKELLRGDPAEAQLRGLAALRELRGRRKRIFSAVLLRHFYDQVLGLKFHKNMVQIRPPRPLPDFSCRIGAFSCQVRRGERGVRLNDVFFTDLAFVSLDTPANSVIYY